MGRDSDDGTKGIDPDHLQPLHSGAAGGGRLNIRSDSLVSFMHQNPRPDFTPNAAAGLVCRPPQF